MSHFSLDLIRSARVQANDLHQVVFKLSQRGATKNVPWLRGLRNGVVPATGPFIEVVVSAKGRDVHLHLRRRHGGNDHRVPNVHQQAGLIRRSERLFPFVSRARRHLSGVVARLEMGPYHPSSCYVQTRLLRDLFANGFHAPMSENQADVIHFRVERVVYTIGRVVNEGVSRPHPDRAYHLTRISCNVPISAGTGDFIVLHLVRDHVNNAVSSVVSLLLLGGDVRNLDVTSIGHVRVHGRGHVLQVSNDWPASQVTRLPIDPYCWGHFRLILFFWFRFPVRVFAVLLNRGYRRQASLFSPLRHFETSFLPLRLRRRRAMGDVRTDLRLERILTTQFNARLGSGKRYFVVNHPVRRFLQQFRGARIRVNRNGSRVLIRLSVSLFRRPFKARRLS